MAEAPPRGQASRYESKAEKVTHFPQIVGLLRRIRDSRNLLTIRIPGSELTFNSMLLEVDADEGYILLDELNQPRGHELVQEKGVLRAFCRCQGVEINFVCRVQVEQSRDGVAFYRGVIPDSLSYYQRRSAYRVHVTLDTDIPVLLTLDEGERLQGHLHDLSVGGIGLTLDTEKELRQGLVIPDCTLKLPKGDPVRTDVEVRFARTDTEKHVTRIGGRFLHLPPKIEARLSRFVAQLERDLLRRKTRR